MYSSLILPSTKLVERKDIDLIQQGAMMHLSTSQCVRVDFAHHVGVESQKITALKSHFSDWIFRLDIQASRLRQFRFSFCSKIMFTMVYYHKCIAVLESSRSL